MSSDILGSYCDGELFQSNKLFQEDPSTLQLQLYFDELKVRNPLGSKAKKHKLGKYCICNKMAVFMYMYIDNDSLCFIPMHLHDLKYCRSVYHS